MTISTIFTSLEQSQSQNLPECATCIRTSEAYVGECYLISSDGGTAPRPSSGGHERVPYRALTLLSFVDEHDLCEQSLEMSV